MRWWSYTVNLFNEWQSMAKRDIQLDMETREKGEFQGKVKYLLTSPLSMLARRSSAILCFAVGHHESRDVRGVSMYSEGD